MARQFSACRQKVFNRGRPPGFFLNEPVDWALRAPADVFARNAKFDICSSVIRQLGPWDGDQHRRAAMRESQGFPAVALPSG